MRKEDLSLWQRFQLWLFGYTFFMDLRIKEDGPLVAHYVVKCEQHGLYVDYPHGHKRYFACPQCLEKFKEGAE